eukprot:TRINITY_DN6454_c1_g1_i1.p1 TRINITY_DN6454_c1_g1~~TRINITY_DN6454_c1_g1_i1.p1  ORF type:complete len:616 (+),score=226.88 TRINITY_DN6454_c1_g1_i1:87-1934(+)
MPEQQLNVLPLPQFQAVDAATTTTDGEVGQALLPPGSRELGLDWAVTIDEKERPHLEVEAVTPGGASAKGGLPAGVEIVEVGGMPVKGDVGSFRGAVQHWRDDPGRQGEPLPVKYRWPKGERDPPVGSFRGVLPTSAEADRGPDDLGWTVDVRKMAGEGLGVALSQELVLNGVDEGSPADEHGLGAVLGWRLTHVDGQPASTLPQVAAAVRSADSVRLSFASPAQDEGGGVRVGRQLTGMTDFSALPPSENGPPFVQDVLDFLDLSKHGYGQLLGDQGYELASDLVGVDRDDLAALGMLPGHANRLINMIFRMAEEASARDENEAAAAAAAAAAALEHSNRLDGRRGRDDGGLDGGEDTRLGDEFSESLPASAWSRARSRKDLRSTVGGVENTFSSARPRLRDSISRTRSWKSVATISRQSSTQQLAGKGKGQQPPVAPQPQQPNLVVAPLQRTAVSLSLGRSGAGRVPQSTSTVPAAANIFSQSRQMQPGGSVGQSGPVGTGGVVQSAPVPVPSRITAAPVAVAPVTVAPVAVAADRPPLHYVQSRRASPPRRPRPSAGLPAPAPGRHPRLTTPPHPSAAQQQHAAPPPSLHDLDQHRALRNGAAFTIGAVTTV